MRGNQRIFKRECLLNAKIEEPSKGRFFLRNYSGYLQYSLNAPTRFAAIMSALRSSIS